VTSPPSNPRDTATGDAPPDLTNSANPDNEFSTSSLTPEATPAEPANGTAYASFSAESMLHLNLSTRERDLHHAFW
jgi:hypothetical protein